VFSLVCDEYIITFDLIDYPQSGRGNYYIYDCPIVKEYKHEKDLEWLPSDYLWHDYEFKTFLNWLSKM